jgi:hypothetical protein
VLLLPLVLEMLTQLLLLLSRVCYVTAPAGGSTGAA